MGTPSAGCSDPGQQLGPAVARTAMTDDAAPAPSRLLLLPGPLPGSGVSGAEEASSWGCMRWEREGRACSGVGRAVKSVCAQV